MENRTDFIGVGLKEKGKQELHNRQEGVVQLLWAGFSYLIAAGSMLEGLSPFGVALVAACPEKLLTFCTIGAVGGSLFPTGVAMSMKYAAAVTVTAVARHFLFHVKNGKEAPWLPPLLAGTALFLSSLALLLGQGFSWDRLLISVGEACLAAAAASFFARAVVLLRKGFYPLQRSDALCGIVSLSVLLLSLSSIGLAGCSLGRIVACFTILCCAEAGGEGAGAIAGVSCGTAIALAQFPDGWTVGAYALSGLLSGVFAHLGKGGCAAAFVLSHSLLALLSHTTTEEVPLLLEALLAVFFFCLVPQRRIHTLKSRIFRRLDQLDSGGMKELLLSCTEDAALAMSEIAKTTREATEALDQLKCGTVEEVYQAALDRVCRKCKRNSTCWQEEYGDSMRCFQHFTGQLKTQGKLTEDDFLYPLSEQCKKKDKLLEVINCRYDAFVEKEGLRRKAAQVRSVVTDQFDGLAQVLHGFGQEVLQISRCDNRLSQKLKAYLDQLPLEVESVHCYRDENEMLFIQMLLPEHKLPRIQQGEELAEELGELCSCSLDLPEIQQVQTGRIRLTFREMAAYYMDFAQSQHICEGSFVCGDSCRCFTARNSRAYLILSDGMGSGSGAAVDSSITVSLLSRLLSANVAYDPALKLVNSALLVKSGEESLATIDLAAVDLYDGQLHLCKAGAAPTFLRRGKRTGYVDVTSLPVGILRSVEFEKSSLKLAAGDLIVMLSDGATENGVEWIRHTIERFHDEDGLQSLCDDICTTARLKRNDARDDDITVMAGVLRKR